jgi:hypothetical protein
VWADPAILGGAFSEVLRYDAPVQVFLVAARLRSRELAPPGVESLLFADIDQAHCVHPRHHAPWSAPLSIPANVWKTWDTPAVISTG